MNLVELKPKPINEYIFENKESILEKINYCIRNDKMNLLMIGCIPKFFIETLIKEYYRFKYNLNNYKDYVLINNYYSDTNISSENNEIVLFSKKKIKYKKIIVIYNLDDINENIQCYFKNIMNEDNFFIFHCETTHKVYESIQMRCINIVFERFSHSTYLDYINDLCQKENIVIGDKDKENIIVSSNMEIDFLINLFNYIKLLKINHVEENTIQNYIHLIQYNQLEKYFSYITQNELKKAFEILFYYHDKGYSLLDIYYFIYEYIKTTPSCELKYKYIDIISDYINKIYQGYDHKLCLSFLTNDFYQKN